jgi:3-methyladenine DNA glycosylase AlkC
MATPLKDYYSPDYYKQLAKDLQTVLEHFNSRAFINKIYVADFEAKELKQRMRHTTNVMHEFLPDDFELAWPLVSKVIDQRSANGKGGGLADLIFPDYIEVYGIDQLNIAVSAIEKTTQYVSCEFAVRPFLLRYEKEIMQQMLKWSKHESYHVRRFASEGCRPRLPWGLAIPSLKKDPAAVLLVLENLKADPSEWVRKSVANNLNDIAKDHPSIVLEIAKRWSGVSKETDAIIKHGSRTLLKSGHAEILKHYGLDASLVSIKNFVVQTPSITTGDTLEFSFVIKNIAEVQQVVRLEYAIYYFMKNGQYSKKVFKISERVYPSGAEVSVLKKHRFITITTRSYYAGKHKLSVIVNGEEKAVGAFDLLS